MIFILKKVLSLIYQTNKNEYYDPDNLKCSL